MLKYYKVIKSTKINYLEPISYEEALTTVLGSYKDNDMTRDMFMIPNRIMCRYSEIEVQSIIDGHTFVAVPGAYNLLPDNAFYDDEGCRL